MNCISKCQKNKKPPDGNFVSKIKSTIHPDKNYFKCVKVPLKHVLKHQDVNIDKITDATMRANKIVIHTLQFIKLYLLDYYDKNNKLFNVVV